MTFALTSLKKNNCVSSRERRATLFSIQWRVLMGVEKIKAISRNQLLFRFFSILSLGCWDYRSLLLLPSSYKPNWLTGPDMEWKSLGHKVEKTYPAEKSTLFISQNFLYKCDFQHQEVRSVTNTIRPVLQTGKSSESHQQLLVVASFLLNVYFKRAIFLRNLSYHQSFYKKMQCKETLSNHIYWIVYLSQDELFWN